MRGTRFPFPVGYVYDEDGATLDPDEEVRAALVDLLSALDISLACGPLPALL